MRKSLALLGAFVLLAVTGCWRPFQQEIIVQIAPNETAFKVPLEGDSSTQEKLQSEEALKVNQVSAKQVSIAQRWQKTGRSINDTDGKWIPAERIIKVNRVPVTREWTNEDDDKKGSSGTRPDINDGLPLGSRDSIAFYANATLTAHIEESDAAKFVYHWGGDVDHEKGASERKLEQVIDTNVRSYAMTELQKRFGKNMFMDCISTKEDYFAEVFVEVKAEFAKVGITIDFFGLHGNLEPKNKEIQASLDKAFITENEKKIAVNQTLMQLERNKQKVNEQDGEANMARSKAEGERDVKKALADGEAYAILTKAEAEAKANKAKAAALEGEGGSRLIAMQQIMTWDGKFPQWWMGGGASPNILLSTTGPTK